MRQRSQTNAIKIFSRAFKAYQHHIDYDTYVRISSLRTESVRMLLDRLQGRLLREKA